MEDIKKTTVKKEGRAEEENKSQKREKDGLNEEEIYEWAEKFIIKHKKAFDELFQL